VILQHGSDSMFINFLLFLLMKISICFFQSQYQYLN